MIATTPIPLSTIAKIELAANRKRCEDLADSVREGIRAVDGLRKCGCPRCLGALKLLDEELV